MIRDDIFIELRGYVAVLLRRWPLVVIPFVVAGIIAVYTFEAPPVQYSVTIRYVIGQPPTESVNLSEEERSFSWITSQFLVSGITDWANGTHFARLVSEEAQRRGVEVPALMIYGNMEAESDRSSMQLVIRHPSAEQLAVIGESATHVLQTQNRLVFPQIANQPADVFAIDDIHIGTVPPPLTALLDIPIRLVLALGIGIGLALLIEYVDPKIYTRRHAQGLGIPVLGIIPKKSSLVIRRLVR